MNLRQIALLVLILSFVRTEPETEKIQDAEYIVEPVQPVELVDIVGDLPPEQTTPPIFKLLYKPTLKKLPTVYNASWGGYINLETYRNDGCNCRMCVDIRAMQRNMRAEYFEEYNIALAQYYDQQSYINSLLKEKSSMDEAAQNGTPVDIVRETLRLMSLNSKDLLADYGCGDGRVLIEAVKMYGCDCVGIEIDPAVALAAAKNVEIAGLTNKITIYVGDVREFDPVASGVTSIYAYLYPELLNQLTDHFNRVRVVGSPYHKISNAELVKHKNINIWLRSKYVNN